MTKRKTTGLFALTLLALVLRLWAADKVAPYIPDTDIIRQAMDMGQRLATGSAPFDTGLSGASKYPLVLPYLLLAIYGAIFVTGRVVGVFHSVREFTSWLFLNRVMMHLVAVTLVSLLSSLAVPLAFCIARRFEQRLAPWLAAIWVTFNLMLIQFSHQARPHVPLAFFVLLAIYFSLRVYETGLLRNYIFAGVAVALASGTLQNGLLAAVPLLTAHLLRSDWRNWKAWLKPRLGWQWVAVVVIAGLGLLVAYPQIIAQPEKIIQLGLTQNGLTKIILGGQLGIGPNAFRLSYIPKNMVYLLGYEPVVTLLGLIGLIYYFFHPEYRPQHVILASFALSFGLIFISLSFSLPHYFSALMPVLAILAARWLAIIQKAIGIKFAAAAPLIVTAIGSLLAMALVVPPLRLDYVLGQSDTRTRARDWIITNLPPGSEIAADFRLEMYPTRPSIERQAAEVPGSLGTREQWLAELSPTDYPMPTYALTFLDVYPIQYPSEFEKLMMTHQIEFLVFEQYMAEPPINSIAYTYAVTHTRRIAVFCPAARLNIWQNYTLPNDLTVPWIELWTVSTPGPIVQIFSREPAPLNQSLLPPC